LEGVSIHDARIELETFLARARLKSLHHDRRDIYRGDVCAEPRRGEADGAAAGRHIQNSHPRTEAGTAQRLRAQAEVCGGDELVVTRRDLVPGAPNVVAFPPVHAFSVGAQDALSRATRRNLVPAAIVTFAGSPRFFAADQGHGVWSKG
jgi:hypothetical protein